VQETSSNFTPPAPYSRHLAVAGLGVMGTVSGVVWFFNPSNFNFFPVCPLLNLTGFACPGCGLTRGFHALFHGDLAAAMDYNALIPVFILVFGLVAVSLASLAVRGKSLIRLEDSPKLLIGLFVLLVGFGVLRNLPFYPFTFLYP